MKPLNVPDRSMSDAAEVSVKGDTACEVLPLPVGNGNRLCDVQGLQAGRRHWLGGMAAALLGGGAFAVCPGVVRAAALPPPERRTVSRSKATLPFPVSRAVPGGVAVVPLGAARRAPKAIWNGIPVLVTGSSSGWFAVLGIPLHTLQDRLVLEVQDAAPGAPRACSHDVALRREPPHRPRRTTRAKVTTRRPRRRSGLARLRRRRRRPGCDGSMCPSVPISMPSSISRWHQGRSRSARRSCPAICASASRARVSCPLGANRCCCP